mmetsp:Transcript_637/g.1476  ORF Transcript_637/g.1476 Transcript_637/m.1476 type:complete len:90 (-) Transcript_637:1694-1963(-)
MRRVRSDLFKADHGGQFVLVLRCFIFSLQNVCLGSSQSSPVSKYRAVITVESEGTLINSKLRWRVRSPPNEMKHLRLLLNSLLIKINIL